MGRLRRRRRSLGNLRSGRRLRRKSFAILGGVFVRVLQWRFSVERSAIYEARKYVNDMADESV
jgi:hypothetical protein